MMSSLYFQVCAAFYIILLTIVFFSKPRLQTIENKIFSYYIVINLVGVCIDLLATSMAIFDIYNPLLSTISKFYLVYLMASVLMFTFYVLIISINGLTESKYYKICKSVFITAMVVAAATILTLPLHNFNEDSVVFTYGPSVSFAFAIAGICIVTWIYCLIINYRNIRDKKYIPIIAFIFLIIVAIIIQFSLPEMLIVTWISVFVAILMFFTIENPDVKMLNQIKEANDELELANQQIQKQMKELEDSQDLLVKQAQMVTLGELAGGMAHDINTPISAINNGMNLLYKKGTDDKQTKIIYDTIQTCTDKIIGIVNSMRDQIRNLGTKVNEYFQAEDIIKDISIVTSTEQQATGCTLRLDIQDNITLYGEKIKLHQVVTNMVMNSIQAYTNNGIAGEVSVTLKRVGNDCIIQISDQAGGISPRIREDLFKKILTTKGSQGTGLGLYLAYSIIKGVFGGDIEVESKMDEGTTIFMTIPIRTKEETAELKLNEIAKQSKE